MGGERGVDIEEVLVPNKISFGEKIYKYFVVYLHNDNKVKPLHTMLPKTSVYVKVMKDKLNWCVFLIEHDDLLEKYNIIWDKLVVDINQEFDSEPLYNK